MNVLLIAPDFDQTIVGESWCTYKWVQGISERCEATVLTTHGRGWSRGESPVRAREVVNWEHRKLRGRMARFGYELKPHYIQFYGRARGWMKDQLRRGWTFDLVHQINPVALRYPSPAARLGVRYITGPHAGSLPTPPGFQAESSDRQWYRKLRALDRWRLDHDPWLRTSFAGAACVIGVAPYVGELLRVRRFEVMAETGAEEVVTSPKQAPPSNRPLRLLFVGRVIRTKGVMDAIRAVALAAQRVWITFDVVGVGDSRETCEAEARRLGISDIVTFHGRLPREQVYECYRKCDVFLFPSFREPSGTVVFEALGFGCPIITATTGGPGHVVNHECGITVEPQTPEQYARGLADAIVRLASDGALVASMSVGALRRVEDVASWQRRLDRLMALYREVASAETGA